MSTANRKRRSAIRFMRRHSKLVLDQVTRSMLRQRVVDMFMESLRRTTEFDKIIRDPNVTFYGGTAISDVVQYGPDPE